MSTKQRCHIQCGVISPLEMSKSWLVLCGSLGSVSDAVTAMFLPKKMVLQNR